MLASQSHKKSYQENPWKQMLHRLRPLISKGPKSVELYRADIFRLLREYRSNEADFKDFLRFHPNGYTKVLIEEYGDDCNVILMCWNENQGSQFHGHEQSKCFVKVLSGGLLEQQVIYPSGNPNDQVVAIKERHIRKDDVSYIDDSIGIHKMVNKYTQQKSVSLHIYMPAYKSCRIFPLHPNRGSLSLSTSYLVDVECEIAEKN